ncbi:AAA family ATPase [Mycolicibacter sinensis]|uniref:AAA family ATPase n=1 Tax=Mycolicibacter sinensis (strain JDM601) TaxID=875328 RepID=UPI000A954428|nr:AAA family ATPase [Mycolicibacter sinensis]
MIPEDTARRKPKGPYVIAAKRYRAAGFLGTIPLPPGQKEPPPTNFTGGGKPYPSDDDVRRWRRDQGDGNIGLRLAEVPSEFLGERDDLPVVYAANNVDGWELIGVDVDNYAKANGQPKVGAAELSGLEAQLGELPTTALSGARFETGSCIAVYLVPKGYRFAGKVAECIEVVQKRHRYMVVNPSTHPDARDADRQPAIYQWRRGAPSKLAEAGVDVVERFDRDLPAISDVAVLPEAWFVHLTHGGMLESDDPISDLSPSQLVEWMESRPLFDAEPCVVMSNAVAAHLLKIADSPSSHDRLTPAHWQLLNLAAEGHSGVQWALAEVGRVWREHATQKRAPETLSAEMNRSLLGALGKIQPRYQTDVSGEYVPDDTCASAGKFDCDAWADRLAIADVEESSEQDGLAWEVERAYTRRRADQLARQRMALEDWAEPEDEGDLAYQIDHPEPVECDLVRGLIRSRGIVLINAQYKTGKTTLASVNLPKALVTGQPFLRKFSVEFGGHECVGIWNLEVDRQDLVDWLERVGIPPGEHKRIYPKCLRGNRSVDFRNPLAVDWTVRWLRERGITVWIIDPLSKLYRGDENSSTEFNAWWSALEEIMQRAGVRVAVLVHHSGHGGEGRARGTSAMMGNPDVLVEYRHGGGHGELPPDNKRYLRAFGRRIDQPSITLDYNPATMELLVDENGGSREENQEKQLALKLWNALQKSSKPLNQGELLSAVGRKAQGKNSAKGRAAIDYAQGRGWITVEKAGSAFKHSIGPNDPYAGHRVRVNLREEDEDGE